MAAALNLIVVLLATLIFKIPGYDSSLKWIENVQTRVSALVQTEMTKQVSRYSVQV